MTEQLVLDLPQRVALARDAFLVADSNVEAVAMIDNFAANPHPVQWIYGPAGSGKTHLAAVLANHMDALSVAVLELTRAPQIADILAAGYAPDVLIIDRLEELTAAQEEVLFHLLNQARHGGVPLLLLSRVPAARLTIGLADLASRLKAIPAVALGLPDDALVAGLLGKLFADRQVRLEPRVMDYLVPRVDRDYAAMGHLVAAIDQTALAQKRAITVPLVAAVLERHSFVADED